MLIWLGYSLAVLMGLTLGLIGAGGSILTVPILVYLLGVKPAVATGYSLLVVGSAAATGAMRYWRKGQVNVRAALIFAAPAMLMVLVTRGLILPSLPDPLLGSLSRDMAIMMLFALLMLAAAWFMVKPLRAVPESPAVMDAARVVRLIVGSGAIGLLTGMVGAGGGFLIIPTLILLFGLQTKEAIGTSLAVIAINSLVGFKGDLAVGIPLDWPLLGGFLGLTLLGMGIGVAIGARMEGAHLKKLFALFTLLVSLAILSRELYVLTMM